MVSSKTISANGERKHFSKGIHIINRETLTVNFIYMYNTYKINNLDLVTACACIILV